jgi:hypothetical protein
MDKESFTIKTNIPVPPFTLPPPHLICHTKRLRASLNPEALVRFRVTYFFSEFSTTDD